MSMLSPVVSKSLCVMVSLHMGHHVLLSLSIVAVYIKASDNEAILYTNTHPCTHTVIILFIVTAYFVYVLFYPGQWTGVEMTA